MKRAVLIGIGVLAAGALILTLIAWVVLASWVPTTGKARLITELEQRYPVDVAIGAIRYHWLRGFILSDVRVTDRDTQQPWTTLPMVQARPGWLALLLGRVRLHGQAVLERPLPTEVTFSGSYALGNGTMRFNGRSTEAPLRALTAPLDQYLPPALIDGTVRLQVEITQPTGQAPVVRGRFIGTRLILAEAPWRFSGDVTVESTAAPPPAPGRPWTVQLSAELNRAMLEGLPTVGSITELRGTARLIGEQIEIDRLTGRMLDAPWSLEGSVALAPRTVEALLRWQVPLALAASRIPPLSPTWQPDGTAILQMVCRGPLTPTMFLDCRSRAELRDASLAGAQLTDPLTNIAGHLAFDLLTSRLSLESVIGRIDGAPFSVSGLVDLRDPATLGLQVQGTIPLRMLRPWLPDPHGVVKLSGSTALALTITGAARDPKLAGTATVRDGLVHLRAPALQLEQAAGTATFSPARIEVAGATMRLNAQPLRLDAVAHLGAVPRMTAVLIAPQGRLDLTSDLTPAAFVIERATLTIPQSHVTVQGSIPRDLNRPSDLRFSGVLELAELARLPFLTLPDLERWELRGTAAAEGTIRGTLPAWQTAAIQSRLRADSLRVRGVPLTQMVATLEQRDGTMRLRIPGGLVADGKLTVEALVDYRTTTPGFQLTADLIGLQLAQLKHTIPAWRERTVAGQASAHAALSGHWQDRAAWRGEGWLNSSGQQLGDLPLLEKVFKGLFGVLAELSGLQHLRRAQITDVSARWHLAKERFYTEDLRIGGIAGGTEPIAVYVKGSVGMDTTLDFIVQPELSAGTAVATPDGEIGSAITRGILKAAGWFEQARQLVGQHRLTGTLEKPDYRFEPGAREPIRKVVPRPTDFLQQIFEPGS